MTNFIIALVASIIIVSFVSIIHKDIKFFVIGLIFGVVFSAAFLNRWFGVIAVVMLFGTMIGCAIWRIRKGLD